MSAPLWNILIPTVPSRAAKLERLLDELLLQCTFEDPSVRVRVTCWLNTGQPRLGVIRDRLVEHAALAGAEYVSFIDDDDMVPDYYVAEVLAALERDPDHVGFPIEYRKDGRVHWPVEHRLKWGRWRTLPNPRYRGSDDPAYVLVRDFTHIDPIRISIARRGKFGAAAVGQMEDRTWCEQVRPWLRGGSEVYIPKIMYHYDWRPAESVWDKPMHYPARSIRRLDIQHPNLEWHPESL